MFASIKEKFISFSDDQRLDRLKICQEINVLLVACQERQRNDTTTTNMTPIMNIEDNSTGFKMMKYFDWRSSSTPNTHMSTTNENGGNNNNNDPTTTSNNEHFNCAKEAHALWACRGVTLACASDLNQLKQCFDGLPKEEILNVSETAYEMTPTTDHYATTTTGDMMMISTSNIPCQAYQQQMGNCIRTRAEELQQRVQGRLQVVKDLEAKERASGDGTI